MCGIFGIVLSEPVEIPDAAILAASEALRTRGPDSLGYFREPGVLLGMRRLSIIDPEGADPPYANESGRIQVVANGEIYNHREIRNRLIREGHVFQSGNDLEVLAHLSETPRLDWELGLRGMFAFALWDRETRTLRLARDRFGIKPLFWRRDERGIAFASSLPGLKALLLSLGGFVTNREWRLNQSALRGYLDTLVVPGPATIYEGVQTLPPANRLIWQASKPIEQTRYWSQTYRPSRKIALKDALFEFESNFRESVRYHLVSDVPVGAFLSGGLDSGYLVAEAAARLGAKLKTYTVGFRESNYSELEGAGEIASACGSDHREIMLDPLSTDDLPRIVSALNQPFGDSSAWPTWAISKAVGADLKVALAGDGGDEIWGGYPYYSLYNLTRWLPKNGQAPPSNPFRTDRISKAKRLLGDAFRSPESLYRRWRSLDPEGSFWNGILRPEYRSEGVDIPFESPADLNGHERMQRADVEFYLPNDLLEKVDTMSMAHSLEVRVPWLDPVLFESVAHFPSRFKINGGLSKWLLRKAIATAGSSRIPPSILHRRKQGFAIPVHDWMRNKLAALFQETALSAGSEVSALLEPKRLRRAFEAHRCGTLRLGHHLWAVLILELWLRENRPAL